MDGRASSQPGSVEALRILEGETRSADGAALRRLLPDAGQPMVGPFILFDHFGPARLPPGRGVDVRPHPHIHLCTISYPFEGEIVHRDHLGACATIGPGDVGWMTAGRGIVHSERSSDAARAADSPIHGLQLWLALPATDEDTDPGYFHHPAKSLPVRVAHGVRLKLLAGEFDEMRAQVRTFSPMILAEAHAEAGGIVSAPAAVPEIAVYVVSGRVRAGGGTHGAGRMIVLAEKGRRIEAETAAHFILLGGAPFEEERHLWWNFVSSSPERIRAAARDWEAGRFEKVPGDDSFIPLPDEPMPAS